ncbi:MAG TPA: WecB/TagA/CpsF family glycosyltransferase [Ignavibacteria bacterium]|nr:WecB/TagA/CpsF family glycosyltransferase [Ignavibacteria bacterium]
MEIKSFYFKGIKISCCDIESSVQQAFDFLNGNTGSEYVCVTDIGNLVNAYKRNPELRKAINNSLLSLPDGRPLSVFAQLKGINNIGRVAGPDFMREVFKKSGGTEIKHFFLGDTEETLQRICAKAKSEYAINICGTHSPDFNPDNDFSDDIILEKIKSAEADFIWVALGGGKQEIWMMNNYRKLSKGIMTGVGAAFRFYLGDIKRAPLFFQKIGMEWFFRLIQQPGKMAGRYLRTLPYFLFYSAGEIFKSKSKLIKN